MNAYNSKVPFGSGSNSDTKPTIEEIVESLTGGKANWVGWKEVKDNGRMTKIPHKVDGTRASTKKSDDWSTYEEIKEVADHFTGIGFTFDGTILGVDLDKCMHHGVITDPLVQTFIEVSNTYTEMSPSGTGVHVLFRLSEPIDLVRNRHDNYEVYNKERYFTFTGHQYNTASVRTIGKTEAFLLLGILGYPWGATQSVQSESATNQILHDVDLDVVKEKMFASKHGTEIQNLYDGDISNYGSDASRADAALCKHLAYWTDGNSEAIKKLWLESGLGQRDKTQQRIDYVDRTVGLVLSNYSSDTTSLEVASTNSSNTPEMTLEASTSLDLSKPLPFSIISGDELMAMDTHVDWMVEDLFTKNALHMLAAPPHNGKTRVALHIAVCVANGIPVFGSFTVPEKMNVLIVNEEDGVPLVRAMVRSSIPEDCSHKNLHFAVDTSRKINEQWAKDLLEQSKALDIGFIILDSLRALHNENENESHVMQPIMDILQHITREGITVLFTHHNRKSQAGGHAEMNIDNARGSSVIGAAIHGYISVTELKQAQQFLIKPIKLKADRARQEPFTVQVEHLVPYDGRMPYTLQYSGLYDPDKQASEHLEDRIAKVMSKDLEQLFTRKYFASIGLVSRADDKTLVNALKRLMKGGYIVAKEYKVLTDTEKEKLPDTTTRSNTIVYRALPKIQQKVDSLTPVLEQVELPEEIEQIEF